MRLTVFVIVVVVVVERINEEKTAEDRMICVVEWYLSLFHLIFLNDSSQSTLRKPLNPILGEVFKCSWRSINQTGGESNSSSVTFLAEQVSHHPTSIYYYNKNIKNLIFILLNPTFYTHNNKSHCYLCRMQRETNET